MPSKCFYGFLLILILSLFCLQTSLGQEDNSGALSLKLVYNGTEVDTWGIKQLFTNGKDDSKLISTVPSAIKNQIPKDLKSAMETETLGDLKKEILPIKESKILNEAKEKWENMAPKTKEIFNKTINWVYSKMEKIKNSLEKQEKDFVDQLINKLDSTFNKVKEQTKQNYQNLNSTDKQNLNATFFGVFESL